MVHPDGSLAPFSASSPRQHRQRLPLGTVHHSRGFTVQGIDNPSPGVESAALYFQGDHAGAAIVEGNELVANGDEALLTEYSATVSGLVITGNTFSGKTFAGTTAGGLGSGSQFTTPNVPRQLVVIGGGPGGGNTSDVTFTNNDVTGTAGGLNADGLEQGNNLVTVDAAGATITGNTFRGTTTRYGVSLRAGRPR